MQLAALGTPLVSREIPYAVTTPIMGSTCPASVADTLSAGVVNVQSMVMTKTPGIPLADPAGLGPLLPKPLWPMFSFLYHLGFESNHLSAWMSVSGLQANPEGKVHVVTPLGCLHVKMPGLCPLWFVIIRVMARPHNVCSLQVLHRSSKHTHGR